MTEKARSPFGGDDDNFTLTEPLPKKRNYAAEAAAAKARKVDALLKLREKRESFELGERLIQISQAFIACSVMPYTRTKETKISRTARLSDGETLTVTITAGSRSEMAYGSDRIFLYWLFDKAVKSGSRFVSFEVIMEYLKDMGLVDSGNNYDDLMERVQRVFGLIICVTRSRNGVTEQKMIPMFRSARLVRKKNGRSKEGGEMPPEFAGKMGMLFDEEFFADLIKNQVPVPLEIIKFARDRPQMLDAMLFLIWRVFSAQTESPMTWDQVREQHGQPDSNPWRLCETFKEACNSLKIIWPEFACESRVENLLIRPPRKGVQLILEAESARNLPNRQLSLSTGGA